MSKDLIEILVITVVMLALATLAVIFILKYYKENSKCVQTAQTLLEVDSVLSAALLLFDETPMDIASKKGRKVGFMKLQDSAVKLDLPYQDEKTKGPYMFVLPLTYSEYTNLEHSIDETVKKVGLKG